MKTHSTKNIILYFGFCILFILSACIRGKNVDSSTKSYESAGNEKVNGKILSTDSSITVLKVWGTHYERGYAYGYLLGDKIRRVYNGYIGVVLKNKIQQAKELIKSEKYFKIEKKYIVECKAIIEGMEAAGSNLEGFDYLDLIIVNSFLDIRAIGKLGGQANGCSSLMAWGEATKDTDLKGKSIITRNLDWTVSPTLVKSNLVLINIPSEEDEQPWLSVGYIGIIGTLSGTNQEGLSIFQHVMYDDFNIKNYSTYEPVWFSIRRALEQKDIDGNGKNDIRDIKDVILQNKNGYADGYIITAMAASNAGADSLIAMVAELGPSQPFVSFRSNSYEDKVNGQILYAANYPICRKDRKRYGNRYNAVSKELEDIKDLDQEKCWEIMTSASCLGVTNLQTMQIIPELGILKLSVWKDGKAAYENKPEIYNLKELFATAK